MDAVLSAGTQVAQLDPLVIISAMAVSFFPPKFLVSSADISRLSQSHSRLASPEAQAIFRHSLSLELSVL